MDPDLGAMAFGVEETRLGAIANRSMIVWFSFMDPNLGAMAFGAEETRLGAMANDAEVLARRWTWRWPSVDVDKTSVP